jgi:hypothetical protein
LPSKRFCFEGEVFSIHDEICPAIALLEIGANIKEVGREAFQTSSCCFLLISMFSSLLVGQQQTSPASAAVVPQLVNFSGKAVDAQGKTISGIAGVTFSIYKDQSTGASL